MDIIDIGAAVRIATEKSREYYEKTLLLAGSADGFRYVKNVVRLGKGPLYYPVGTQFVVKKENSMTATMGTHTGITAVSVNEETFLAHEGRVGSGIHEFEYDGAAWQYEGQAVILSDFGISITGTPASGDQVIITESYSDIIFEVVDHRVTGEGIAAYDATKTYAQGDMCTYDGYVWLCTTTIGTAEAWTAGHWEKMIETGQYQMILLMYHCIYGRQFDQTEAICYTADGLAAGAYCFTVKNQAWYAADNDKTYYFTLTQAVPAGGQLVLSMTYNAALEGKSVKTYSSKTSTTEIETATLSATEIAGATDLGNTDGNSSGVNFMHRAIFGSNNYRESALRQWINSEKAANAWWAPTNDFDRPPSYANAAGLLHGMDKDFLDSVAKVKIPCKTNNTYELPGWTKNAAYTVEDRFFLPSRDEMGYGKENVAEGQVFDLYDGASNADKIKRDLSAQTTARPWFHRSPHPSNGSNVRYTSTSGAVGSYYAIGGSGAAAACVIM